MEFVGELVFCLSLKQRMEQITRDEQVSIRFVVVALSSFCHAGEKSFPKLFAEWAFSASP